MKKITIPLAIALFSCAIVFHDSSKVNLINAVIVENRNLKYSIDTFKKTLLGTEICGWAFIEDIKITEYNVVVFLKKDNDFYKLPIIMQKRNDISTHFKKDHEYDFTGFVAKIAEFRLPKGSYTICIGVKVNGQYQIVNTGKIIEA